MCVCVCVCVCEWGGRAEVREGGVTDGRPDTNNKQGLELNHQLGGGGGG